MQAINPPTGVSMPVLEDSPDCASDTGPLLAVTYYHHPATRELRGKIESLIQALRAFTPQVSTCKHANHPS